MKSKILVLCFALGCAFFLYNCSSHNDTEIEAIGDYSGEDIFRAIFFLEGEAAQKIESLKPTLVQLERQDSTQGGS